MKKAVFSSTKLRVCVWLALTLLVLSLYSTPNVLGGIYDFMTQQSNISAMAPSVVLENSTAGTNTIYANGTSAMTSVGGSYWTYYPSGYSVLTGTRVSGSVPTSVQSVDSDYFVVRSSGSGAPASPLYNPSNYSLLGSTTLDSGTTGDLVSNNGVYITFKSYASSIPAQTLYAHQETTTIGGTNYYLEKLTSADAAGTSLSVSMAATGRQLLGTFVYPLTDLSSIPASTWTFYYRTWYSSVPQDVVTNSPSSTPAGTWTNPTYAYTSDNFYATTETDGATQQYGNYGFNIPSGATINKVEVGFEAYTAGDEKIGITLSWDNGASWATEYVSGKLGTTDPNTVTWVDFTTATSWTPSKLSNANFQTSAKGVRQGAMSTVYLDWIPARVTYTEPPSAHADANVLIRKSDNTIRQTIATDVANSGALSTTAQTLSVTYAWSAYTVMNQTDYLEIDYYIDVTTAKSGVTAYLRIDDNTLAIASQTRTTNVMLPNEHTMEVEFTGSSNTYTWAQLDWTVDSAWDTGSVTVTLQLYNYSSPGGYPTSGDGYISYTSNSTADTDQTKTQSITVNPQSFRDASGNWKVKIKGVKSTGIQFKFKADWIEFKTKYYNEYTVSTQFTFSSMNTTTPSQLNFTIVSQYDIGSVSVSIQVYNYTGSSYSTSGQGCLNYTSSSTPNTDETKNLTITTNPQDFVSSGNATIKIIGTKSTQTQFQQKTNQLKLDYKSVGLNYNHVLKVVNTVPEAWQIRLTAYAQSGIGRLQNLTIYVYDGLNSTQIIILNGIYNKQTGPWYDLADYDTEYIWVHVETSNTGTSYIYTYLEILSPNTTTTTRYIITFKIT